MTFFGDPFFQEQLFNSGVGSTEFDMKDSMRVLIIGGDGTLGGGVRAALGAEGIDVISTTRHRDRVDSCTHYLDLRKPQERWSLSQADVCLISAAVTKMDDCRKDFEGTWDVNVRAPIEIARSMVDKGARVLFLSTNQVFDGKVSFREAYDEKVPASAYGRQKAAAEDGILALSKGCSVLRLTNM